MGHAGVVTAASPPFAAMLVPPAASLVCRFTSVHLSVTVNCSSVGPLAFQPFAYQLLYLSVVGSCTGYELETWTSDAKVTSGPDPGSWKNAPPVRTCVLDGH